MIEDNREIFDSDIMNVHYQKYYSDATEKIPPGDWENPNPIFFLAIKEGIKFDFNVLFDNYRKDELIKADDEILKNLKIPEVAKDVIKEFCNQNLTSEVKCLIEEALKEFGVGAKTRLGYGIFE